ncbi:MULTISPECIES: hypothetical protein [unclassified Clostridium]|uniref:hypothetical protein n=1 Tax=unclassified Clostridium TaxID=2614128 RepID=UPI00029748D4|nr:MULTISPECIES: hypothetical protein [unclassified Clostridium]EKQ51579.1 MAG: hypothetical protein A370_04757 [Clostridium sp. Maddingley MBC34-26]
MRKFIITLCIFFSFSLCFPVISSMAQQQSFKQGIYKIQDLNLPQNNNYTLQNKSPTEYAIVIIFDANQIVQQLIQLPPLSNKYDLTPMLPGYEMIIVGKGDIVIS